MSCPTCSHTMNHIASDDMIDAKIFWCPRCGTVVTGKSLREVGVPSLILRCREYANVEISQDPQRKFDLTIYGILESISTEEERTKP